MTNLIRLHTFHGGIHPAENKQQSTAKAVQPAPLPAQLVLPLHQHIGAPAVPVVSVGDHVLKGQLIATAEGFVSVPLHAPTSGKISAIEPRPVPHASGLQDNCIVIEPDGKDQWIGHKGLRDILGVSAPLTKTLPQAKQTFNLPENYIGVKVNREKPVT